MEERNKTDILLSLITLFNTGIIDKDDLIVFSNCIKKIDEI